MALSLHSIAHCFSSHTSLVTQPSASQGSSTVSAGHNGCGEAGLWFTVSLAPKVAHVSEIQQQAPTIPCLAVWAHLPLVKCFLLSDKWTGHHLSSHGTCSLPLWSVVNHVYLFSELREGTGKSSQDFRVLPVFSPNVIGQAQPRGQQSRQAVTSGSHSTAGYRQEQHTFGLNF